MYGRIEVDRSELVRQALATLVPSDLHHTVRLHCDVLQADGAGVMSAVSAGSLALMDAGVPLRQPAAGMTVALLLSDPPAGIAGAARVCIFLKLAYKKIAAVVYFCKKMA